MPQVGNDVGRGQRVVEEEREQRQEEGKEQQKKKGKICKIFTNLSWCKRSSRLLESAEQVCQQPSSVLTMADD